MIKTLAFGDTQEEEAARDLEYLILKEHPSFKDAHNVNIYIIPSVQCFGESTQDIDLVLLMFDKRGDDKLLKTKTNQSIRSLCVTIEVKGHHERSVSFIGTTCMVEYHGESHNATSQSEKQKYSLREYINKNKRGKDTPWVNNVIWLRNVSSKNIPHITSNIIPSDASWTDFINIIGGLNSRPNIMSYSDSRSFELVKDILTKEIGSTVLDRRKIEAISKSALDREQAQYYDKFGKQLLIFRGRGGTGKTIRLLQIAYHLYNTQLSRVLVLTYNAALVSDLSRLMAIMKIKNVIAGQGIQIRTIHSFMYKWMDAAGLDPKNNNFLTNYEPLKKELSEYLNEGVLTSDDIKQNISKESKELMWDYILIDESQDWPESERDLLYKLYDFKKFILADGVDQLVRSIELIDWRHEIERSETQIVPLHKSLRLKSGLTKTVQHFADAIGYGQWDLKPLPESHGGRVVVLEGDIFSKELLSEYASALHNENNENIDMLFCVPASWTYKKESHKDGKLVTTKHSRISDMLQEWGYSVWDGVDNTIRHSYPTDTNQFRVVQYDSCRGLEGWTVVNLGFDELYDTKLDPRNISDNDLDIARRGTDGTLDWLIQDEDIYRDYANKWLMIPLTRAIDTLIIHIKSSESYVGKILKDLEKKHPGEIQWLSDK